LGEYKREGWERDDEDGGYVYVDKVKLAE